MTVVAITCVPPMSSYIFSLLVLKTFKATLQGETGKGGYLANKERRRNYLQLDAKSNTDVTFQPLKR